MSLADAAHPEGSPGSCWGWTPAVSQDCYSTWHHQQQGPMLPTTSVWLACKSEVPTQTFAGTAYTTQETLIFTLLLYNKGYDRVYWWRGTWGNVWRILSPEASVPIELGCTTLWASGCVHQARSSPILMEALSCNHDRSLTPFSTPLPFLEKEGGTENPKLLMILSFW